MTLLIKTLAAVAAGAVLATSAFAQGAREIRGASPYDTIENEPAPKLIVDPPLPGPLAQGIFQAQYRVQNVRILPVFGAGALNCKDVYYINGGNLTRFENDTAGAVVPWHLP